MSSIQRSLRSNIPCLNTQNYLIIKTLWNAIRNMTSWAALVSNSMFSWSFLMFHQIWLILDGGWPCLRSWVTIHWNGKSVGPKKDFGSETFLCLWLCHNWIFSMLGYCRFWWGSSCSFSCDMGHVDPLPLKLNQKPISRLCVKSQPSRTSPSGRI